MKSPRAHKLFLLLVTMSFAIRMANAQTISSVTMVDTSNHPLLDLRGAPIANPLIDNQTIFLNQLKTPSFSFVANASGAPSKITFYLTNVTTHTQLAAYSATSAPFSPCAATDCSAIFPAGSSSCGTTYLLQAVPYSAAGAPQSPYSASFTVAPGGGLAITQDPSGENISVLMPSNTGAEVLINDAPLVFAGSPVIVDKTGIKDGMLQLNTQQSGLVQGVTYYFQSLPSGAKATCVIQPQKWNVILPQPDYLSQAWAKEGRLILQYNAGMIFRGGAWSVPTPDNWSYGPKNLSDGKTAGEFQVGQQAEDVDMAVQQGVHEAAARNDLQMMDELAQFFLRFYDSTAQITLPGDAQPTTVGARVMTLAQMDAIAARLHLSTAKLNSAWLTTAWPKTTKTIPTASAGTLTECPLCNEIFLYPAAKLVRLVSAIPAANRKPNMKPFVDAYVPFLVNDQILRLTYNHQLPLGSCAAVLNQSNPSLPNPASRYQLWNYQAAHGIPKQISAAHLECYAMFNNDLYLIGMAAELLGANANDRDLVPLSSCSDPRKATDPLKDCQLQSLHNALTDGVAFFQLKKNLHPAKDFRNNPAAAVSYFDGDQAALIEHAFSCHNTADYPADPCNQPGSASSAVPLVSWDVSHYAIVPIFLRTLYDNKKILGGNPATNFPQASDLRQAANQLVYNVLHHPEQPSSRQLPVFSNFMDGTDGWYRIGYHGPNSGAAPSEFCDAQNANRERYTPQGPWLCVASPGVTAGWGLLSLFNPDLNEIEQNFVSLAQNYQTHRSFLDQHYFYIYPFSFRDAEQNLAYPPALANILFLNAAQLP